MACKLVQREGVEQEEQQCMRRWTRMTAARGRRLAGSAGAELGGESGCGAAARGGVSVRGRRRRGVAAAAACSGEHGRGDGVRAVVQGRRFREEEERPSEADAWDPRKS